CIADDPAKRRTIELLKPLGRGAKRLGCPVGMSSMISPLLSAPQCSAPPSTKERSCVAVRAVHRLRVAAGTPLGTGRRRLSPSPAQSSSQSRKMRFFGGGVSVAAGGGAPWPSSCAWQGGAGAGGRSSDPFSPQAPSAEAIASTPRVTSVRSGWAARRFTGRTPDGDDHLSRSNRGALAACLVPGIGNYGSVAASTQPQRPCAAELSPLFPAI